MKATIKIHGAILDAMREDLRRPHAFAHERIGFLTAGVAEAGDGLLLAVRSYTPVADEDYERAPGVGAQIGASAIRKALQSAYRPQTALLHIHTHGGWGIPSFSRVDLVSGQQFVPSFFNMVPKMPHGLLVMSDNDANGILWCGQDKRPVPVTHFIRVGAPYKRTWGTR